MTQPITERLHIVEGVDWTDAVISLLAPASPYDPWRYGLGEAREGDPVAVILDTDPVSAVTEVGHVGADGDVGGAVIDVALYGAGLVDLSTLVMMTGFAWNQDPRREWQLLGDAAIRMELALTECQYRHDDLMRFGHTSLVKARILLVSQGQCAGCDTSIDLAAPDARDAFGIHTVDVPNVRAPQRRARARVRSKPPADWPGVVCRACERRMAADGYTSLLDYRFAQHPGCPECGERRTKRAAFGMRKGPEIEPWLHARGCCVTPDEWTCSACEHQW